MSDSTSSRAEGVSIQRSPNPNPNHNREERETELQSFCSFIPLCSLELGIFSFLVLETTDGFTFDAIPKVKLLRTLPYIRKRCADVRLLAREGKLRNFQVEEEKLKEAAMIVKVRGTVGIWLKLFCVAASKGFYFQSF